MKTPLDSGELLTLDVVASTQDTLSEALRFGSGVTAVLAQHQTQGRGRFERPWHSEAGDSLTLSLAFPAYADHPKPWFIGMAVAAAAAAALHCRVQWPNDLVLDGKKLGGILSEMMLDAEGRRVPVVGVGVNLNQKRFPDDIADKATSLALHRDATYDAARVAQQIIERISLLPEPDSWENLRSVWMLFDSTPGKKYLLPNGDKAVALGIGPDGELICAVDGETTTVMVADAIFGA